MTQLLTRLLSRLRTPFKNGAVAATGHYGVPYTGHFEPAGLNIIGVIGARGGEHRFPPASVIALRDGQQVGSTNEYMQQGAGWTFKLVLATPIPAAEVLQERLKVYAVDRVGARYELLIDGAVQLGFVREVLAPPSETELLIEFGRGGNSTDFVRTGWSLPEPQHTWTDGKESTLAIPFDRPGAYYRIEILAWPYVVRDVIAGQRIQVLFGDTFIRSLYALPGLNMLEFDISGELTSISDQTLRLELPDAARPYEVTGEGDRRILALAVRRLKVKRWLQPPPQDAAHDTAAGG